MTNKDEIKNKNVKKKTEKIIKAPKVMGCLIAYSDIVIPLTMEPAMVVAL
jgi:hypothetical protein